MKRKSILIILVIVVLLVIIGFLSFGNLQLFNQKTQVTVGAVNFTLPNGYHEGELNKEGDINITDGKNSIFIKKYDDSNLTKYVDSYNEYMLNNSYKVDSSELTMDNIKIYKSVNTNTSAVHYWFKYGNKGYSIYTWGKVDNIDNTVFDLIGSLKN